MKGTDAESRFAMSRDYAAFGCKVMRAERELGVH
jgi:hypothetical protein